MRCTHVVMASWESAARLGPAVNRRARTAPGFLNNLGSLAGFPPRVCPCAPISLRPTLQLWIPLQGKDTMARRKSSFLLTSEQR